jgi:hypothetical protein
MSDEISRAQADEAATLSAIAWSAKAHWGYPRRWLEHWRKLLTISPEFIEANGVFRATRAGETVAFYALLERPSQHRLEHLWSCLNGWDKALVVVCSNTRQLERAPAELAA